MKSSMSVIVTTTTYRVPSWPAQKPFGFRPDGGVSESASGVVQELSELPAAIERLTSQMGLG
jgi:hypothetical protein